MLRNFPMFPPNFWGVREDLAALPARRTRVVLFSMRQTMRFQENADLPHSVATTPNRDSGPSVSREKPTGHADAVCGQNFPVRSCLVTGKEALALPPGHAVEKSARESLCVSTCFGGIRVSVQDIWSENPLISCSSRLLEQAGNMLGDRFGGRQPISCFRTRPRFASTPSCRRETRTVWPLSHAPACAIPRRCTG